LIYLMVTRMRSMRPMWLHHILVIEVLLPTWSVISYCIS
jgi:hypothetical protein